MIAGFGTVVECLKQPSRACGEPIWTSLKDTLGVTGFEYAALIGLALIALGGAAAGWQARRGDDEAYRDARGTWFVWAFVMLVIAVAMFGAIWFVPYPNSDASALQVFSWGAVASLAAGVALVIAGIAYAIGGIFGRLGKGMPRGRPFVIAIDGPAASGKGTLAKRIAEYYKLPCVDTGLLYRAVARDVAAKGGSLEDQAAAIAAAKSLDPHSLADEALRTAKAGEAASVVAKFQGVRDALLDYQRAFAHQGHGAVLDGRDIGTIVCPEADVKIYVTATSDERAHRRHKELTARGETVSYEDVLEDIRRRDARDIGRDVAPLWPAKDAVQLDTTTLGPEAAFDAAIKIIKKRLKLAV
jgi:cytidylate kinase